MDSEQLKLFLREGEGLTIEFKEKFSSHIDEDIVAFANTKGGTLLLGVCDNGTKGSCLYKRGWYLHRENFYSRFFKEPEGG